MSTRRRAAAWIKRKIKAFVTEPADVLLRLEQLEERENPAPVATVTGLGNVTPFLGETATFSFTFTNTHPTDVGFSPFFDLILETSGPDGTTNSPPTSLNPTTPATAADGFAASSGGVVNPTVTVSGLALIPIGAPVVLTAGQTTYANPFTGQTYAVPAGYGAGDTVFTYQLPFGSFTPGQNTLVTFTAPTSNLADVGTPLDLTVRPGFRDTDGDPNAPLVPAVYTDASAAAIPKLYDFVKTYVGPENETATGPNYVRRYRLSVDIAAGQTIQNLVVTDNLGPTMQLAGLTSANMAAFLASSGLGTNVFNGANRGGTATATAPDGTVSYSFGNVTGVAGTDAVFEFDFFVPRDDSSAAEVLPQPTPPAPNPAGGTDSITDANTASTAGTWTPLDSRDAANQNVAKAAPDNGPHTLQEHSVAVQKTVDVVTVANPNTPAGGPILPGQTLLRYTIDFQVSDYYAVNNLFLEDALGDGQRLYLAGGLTPTLTVQNPWTFANGGERAATSTGAFAGANTIDYERRYTIVGSSDSDPTAGVEGYGATGPTGGPFSAATTGTVDGTTLLRFNISDELIARGLPGVLVGGEIANGGGNPQNLRTPPFGPARGVVTFWALVKEEYSDDFPSGDNSVDQGDALENSVPLIRGDHLGPTDLSDGTPTALGTTGTDDSGTSVTITNGLQTKTVYAINDTLIPAQGVGDTVFSMQAGDRVTYKLTYTLPISRFEDLAILDIPPLPVMAVGSVGNYTFDRTPDGSFNAYEIEVAPDDTFFSTFPGFPSLVPGTTITTNATTNTITMTFGDFDDPQDRSTTISLLVTLPVSGDSFVSDLFLTNQLRVNEGNTFLGTTTVEDLRRIQLVRPQITVDKGIVGFGNTGRALGGHTFTAPNDPPTAASTPAFTGVIDTAAEADAVGAANVATSDNVDAADRVRYAIVAQNTGFGDAYDVVIEDQIQPGYVIPATFAGLNLNVRHGDGSPLTNFAEVQGFARVATTGALAGATFSTTAGGTFTDVNRLLDSVSLNVNEFVLVKDQATASQNGVYQVSAVDAATNTVTLVRAIAFDTAAELSNSFVAVMGGTSANRYFQAGAVATLNTSAVNYTLQAATQDYYAIYDPATGAFRLLLSDNYTAGNVSNTGEVPDDRAGGISRARATPLVFNGDSPPVTAITNGSNTVVVQYDLILASTVAPNQSIVNTARVSSYGTSEAGEDVTEPANVTGGTDPTDTATAVVKLPTNAKTLIGTSVTETGNAALNQAVIGELVTYEVVLTVPEGETPGANLFDTLDEGLAFVDITNVTLSSTSLSTSNGLTFANNGATNTATLTANTTTGGSNNRQITFTLGTVTNANVDNAVAETITIRYRAVVRNVNTLPGDADGNQSGDLRNNSARLRWTNNTTTLGTVSAANVTVAEPALTNVKDVAVQNAGVGAYSAFAQRVRADAGDNIRYRLTITNGTAATDTTAFDVTLSDQLPTANFVGGAGAFSLLSVTTTGAGSVRRNGTPVTLTTADFAISGTGLLTFNLANTYDIEPNVQIVLTVEALNYVGATGQLVNNVADLRWTSLSGAVAGERTGADGEGNGLNNYADLDDAQIESPPIVRKTLVATSEGHTSGADVAVGEIARFRLVASVPEGATSNFQIQDLIPAGLSFLNDGTARWGFVSTGGNVISSASVTNVTGLGTPTTATAGIDGNQATLATLLSSAIVGTFNDDNVSTGSAGAGTGEASVYANGADVFFRFGDVANTDNDTDFEYVVVEFNALVGNVTGNQAATTLSNTMTLLADTDGNGSAGYIDVVADLNGDGVGTGEATVPATDANNDATSGTDTPALSQAVALTVREPNIGITKAVTATTGTVVTYSVVLSNTGANALTAFNARVVDALDGTNLTLVAGSVAFASATASGIVDNTTGNTVDIAIGTLPAGGSVLISYQANVLTTPTGTTTLDNTVSATTTSLPGPSGTGGAWTGTADTSSAVPGASGTGTGERTGADGVGGALNDYAATATQSLGSLGDRVYVDYDADGVQDTGEPGIAGAPVVVRWAGPNGTFGDGDDSVINATTGANGVYTVTGLPVDSPGQYRVSVDTTGAPFTTFGLNTFTDSIDNGVLSATTPTQLALTDAVPNPRTQDFGYRGTASIGNFVWHDIDGDGAQDAGEPGIPAVGVTVTWHGIDGALGGGDDLVVTTTTDANGGYSVGNLPAGAYTVTITTATLPDNFTQTFDLDGIGGASANTAARTLATGENATDVDFGYRGTSSVGDTVWYDADGDGTQDAGEPGIPGVTVTLLFGGDDGNLTTTADNITYTTTTDASGNYLFPSLFGGDLNAANPNYRVTVTQPAAFPSQTFDATAPTNDNQSSLQLADNTANLLQDFGYRGTASLGDFVWEDLNGSGRQDALEPGIVGVTVELFYAGADGVFQAGELVTPLLTTTTGALGAYSFPNLAAGTYRVRFGTSDGTTTYTRTAADIGANDAIDSDANATTGFTGDYALANGASNITVDAGLYIPIALGDLVWLDLNANGTLDGQEVGIPNATVTATWFGPDGALGGGDDQTFTGTTDASGIWGIANLPPGNYSVAVTAIAAGLAPTYDLDSGLVAPNGVTAVVAVSGTDRADVDFGYRGPGAIGDRVFLDVNANGTFDAGEGLDGVTVTLTGDIDGDGTDESLTTATGPDGFYQFIGLRAPAGGVPYTVTVNTAQLPRDGANNPITNTVDPDGGANSTSVVTLTSAVPVNLAQDFGYRGPGRIGDTVFLDANNNGAPDAGEGITGVVVRLRGDVDGDTTPDDFLATTNASGVYDFSNLPVRDRNGALINWTVTVDPAGTTLPAGVTNTVDPNGGNDSVSTLALDPVTPVNLLQDFGYRGTGAIGDRVFLDLDGDGAFDAGEGLTGITVTLTADVNGDGASETFTTTTDADGFYQFSGLPIFVNGGVTPVAYTVTVVAATLPTGVTNTTDPDGGNNNTSALTLVALASNPLQDFGYRGTATLGDRVWIDSNGDGIQGPVALEPGLPAVGVTLVWAGQDNTFGTADDATTSTTTSQLGAYGFANLPPGTYRTTVATGGGAGQVPSNMTQTFDLDGLGTANSADRALALGENATNVDFGYVGNASVGDRVWIDQDGDGVQDASEPGVPGATVQLRWAGPNGTLDDADDVFFTTTTGANGLYLFPGLPVYGTDDAYRVTVTALPVAGLTPTYDLDSALVSPDQTAAFLVTTTGANQNRRDVDFGYDGLGSLAGTVYHDLNNDGLIQGNEPRLAGVAITLTGVDVFGNPVLDPATGLPYTTTTDANGNYLFPTVIPGTYTITEAQPAAFNDGIDTSGTLGGNTTTNDAIGGIVVGPSQAGVNYNFGELGTFLSGTVFRDTDRDGALDAGEPGIAGVELRLFGADGVTLFNNPATGTPYIITTDANGFYSFNDIPAGTYVVRETQPAGYADSPVGPSVTLVGVVPLAGLPNQNFGEVLGSLAGRVYIDLNNNGTQQGGENPLAGIAVTLTGTDVNGAIAPVTVFTDASGNYLFDNLFAAAGAGYTITEGSAAPFTDAVPNATGTAAGTPGTNTFSAIPLAAGQQGSAYNFGELPPVGTFLAGVVYYDADRDGVRDAGETGIAGVTISLTAAGADGAFGTGDDTTTTTTTDANGNYLFTGLVAGTVYLLNETQPNLYGSSTPNAITTVPLPAAGLLNQNFGETLGTISGSVYFDANTSGTRTAGEPGLAGVQVTLTGTDANGAAVNRTTTTDANGNYSFDALGAGLYVITEPVQPAGYVDGQEALGTGGGAVGADTFTNVPLSGGANLTSYDFGEIGVPVSGTVFRDADRDGTLDGGEPPIPGVTVQLIDANGTVVRTTTTDANGNYTFPNVPPGTYTIRELQPTGYGNPPAGPFAPDTRPITVAGTAVTNQNFGDTLSTLGGSVYVDANNDGVRQGGETGIPGVPVALDFAGADGAFGTGDDVANFRTTTTNANGDYAFTLLPAGVYRVRETVQPSPYGDGIDTPGSASGDATTNDQITAVPVGAGTDLTAYNFGELAPANPFISGTVYVDLNNNGSRDGGEPGIPNVTVGLANATVGAFLALTDANGNYTFPNLIAGLTYDLTEGQPTGYANGLEAPGNLITVPNLPASGSINNNFGELLGSIAGTVYFDRDAGGALDGADGRLPGVTVTLLDSNGAQALHPLTGAPYIATTDANGNYLFDQLLAGTYRVIETQPTEYNQGTNTPGTGAALGGTDRIDVTLAAGAASTANNFGEIGAPISGRVYLDENRDGTRQPGETTGLGGVLITLLDANGGVVATTTTANDGTYSFTNLPPGTYTLVQTQPNLFGSTSANVLPVVLTAAGVVDQDFGEVLGSLAGSVFRDVNANGSREAGEPGISGVSVTLTGVSVNGTLIPPQIALTDANGNYLFPNLVAGTYTVVETQPLAFVDGQERVGSVGGNATTNDQFNTVPLAAGASGTSYLFGELTSSLSGFVYRDFDLSGARNLTGANPDTGIGGILITLTGTDLDGRAVNRTATTAADGSYLFEGLGGGNYTITETQPPLPTTLFNGFYDGADNLGSLSGTQPVKNALAVELANGQHGINYNFGELPPADPFGFVYVDQNQNGVRDAGEVGIPNVAITIGGTAFAGTIFARPLVPGDIPGGSFTILTDATGRYEFNPIPPGLYSIREAQPSGYADGLEQDGDPNGPPATVGNDVFTNIMLAPFPVRGPFNFGEIVPQVPLPPVSPLPPADVNKTQFLSSTPVGVNTTTTPLYINSVARLGVQSPVASIAVAASTDAGRPGAARLLDFRTAGQRLSVDPYPGFLGGVRVAVGDVNRDGVEDLITGAGAGAGSHIKAFDGATGQLLLSFFAYDPAYLGGVEVAAGDVTGDGFADIVTAAGPGVGPHVKAFDGRTGAEVASFYAYDAGFLGGVRVAVGDVNRDGIADIVTGTGAGAPPHVKAFSGATRAELASFYAFDVGYRGGVNVAVADVDGNGAGEIVAAAASGPSSHVTVHEVGTQRLVYSFLAWPGYAGNGIRVASADINGDSGGDLIVSSGTGGGTRISVFSGRGLALLDDFLGFDPYGTGGVFVG